MLAQPFINDKSKRENEGRPGWREGSCRFGDMPCLDPRLLIYTSCRR